MAAADTDHPIVADAAPYRCRSRGGGLLTAGSRAAVCCLPQSRPLLLSEDSHVVAMLSISSATPASNLASVALLAWPSGTVIARIPSDSEPITAAALCVSRPPAGGGDGAAALDLFLASRSLTTRHFRLELPGDLDQSSIPLDKAEEVRAWRPHSQPVADVAIRGYGEAGVGDNLSNADGEEQGAALLATASADHTARVWDVATGHCTHAFTAGDGIILRCMFHPDPQRHLLFTASEDGSVRGWDLISRTCEFQFAAHFSAATAMCLGSNSSSKSANVLFSTGRDQIVHMHSLTGKDKTVTFAAHESLEAVGVVDGEIGNLILKSTGGGKGIVFLTAGSTGRLKLWRSDRSAPLYSTEGGLGGLLGCGVLSAIKLQSSHAKGRPQRFLLTLVEGRLTQVAVKCTGESGIHIEVEHEIVGDLGEVTDAAFLPLAPSSTVLRESTNNRIFPMVVVATNSEVVRVHDTATASLSVAASLPGHTAMVLCLSVDRGGSREGKQAVYVAAGAKDGRALIWRQWLGERQQNSQGSNNVWQCIAAVEGHVSSIAAIVISIKHRILLTGAADRTLKSWALPDSMFEDQKEPGGHPEICKLKSLATVAAHEKDLNCAALAPNGKLAISGGGDKVAKLWQMPDLIPKCVIRGHRRSVWCAAFSPVDRIVATGSADGIIRLWSVSSSSLEVSGGVCLRSLEGHAGSVLRVAFIKAGTFILSGGGDGTLRTWNVHTGEQSSAFPAHDERIWALGHADDGELVVSGGADGYLSLWQNAEEEIAAERREEASAAAEAENRLALARSRGDLQSAIQLAIELDRPRGALQILQEHSSEIEDLSTAFAALSEEYIARMLKWIISWNANSKTCWEAQSAFSALVRGVGLSKISACCRRDSRSFAAFEAFSVRHAARVERLQQAAALIDYALDEMGVLGSEQISELMDTAD